MWQRNCLFIAVCLAGAGLVGNTLLRRERIASGQRPGARGQDPRARDQMPDGFAKSVGKLNATFRDHWQAQGIESAPAADHLTIARRLSLAMVGTVPSLEEVRALEAVPEEQRV